MCFFLKPYINTLCDTFDNSLGIFMAVQKSVRQFFQAIYQHDFTQLSHHEFNLLSHLLTASANHNLLTAASSNLQLNKKLGGRPENCLMFSKIATENILSKQTKFKKIKQASFLADEHYCFPIFFPPSGEGKERVQPKEMKLYACLTFSGMYSTKNNS